PLHHCLLHRRMCALHRATAASRRGVAPTERSHPLGPTSAPLRSHALHLRPRPVVPPRCARTYDLEAGTPVPPTFLSPASTAPSPCPLNEEETPLSPVNAAQPEHDAAPAVPTLDEVSAQVRSWVDAAATRPVPGPAKMLSDLLQDPKGLDFTLAFVDRVIRPEDPRAAAVELRRLAQDPPAFLPAPLRRAVALGGAASRLAPSVVVPTAQAAMRRMVGHLILDARPGPLGASITRLTADGTHLNINLLGEAVLGAQEAARRLEGVRELVARPDVDYASIKVSSIVDHLPLWAAAETVDHIVETLLPLYLEAARAERPTFLNMD